ncbi:acyl-CoA thioesterase II [Mycobacterium sp. CBMA 234]|uniref:acyl-CoA thioesterase n=1 Tax=Mycolicibacterium sp. CBMA 234 TaxID=1918495 RepID=UPI0013910C44|nr:acyl-CoA thioesterase domain-containing protein [Mycolicibacterium sp. CBMA 234]MUL68027.1 acyl-CoA thioesterase II [Mycolicibacterium sp. CBMA 234]
MPDLWTDLLECLNLAPQSPDDAGLFTGCNQTLEYHRIFGGQLLGQFVRAACLSTPDKAIKSIHTVFPREGRADEPITYQVTRHHEGRSFATLSIVASQSKGAIATASISMHAPEDGRDQQFVEEVPTVLGPEHGATIDLIPWETRSADSLDTTAVGPAEYSLWMRTPAVDTEFAPALAAYATDLTLIGTAIRPLEGLSQRGNGTAFTSAVTSHTLWFHRPFRTDDWLLLRQHSPLAAQGRCFGRGDLLTAEGALVASYAQEALLRL